MCTELIHVCRRAVEHRVSRIRKLHASRRGRAGATFIEAAIDGHWVKACNGAFDIWHISTGTGTGTGTGGYGGSQHFISG